MKALGNGSEQIPLHSYVVSNRNVFDNVIPSLAPISKNTALGFAFVKLDGEIVSKAKLIALEDIKEGSFYRKTVDSLLQIF